ncbi:hypothetical protein UP10_28465 [Bradyrhizobium sp. LTSPM299]|nr:hypothetical protein UP10_28465 [Bradyrhizobium sp. LTSPM299]
MKFNLDFADVKGPCQPEQLNEIHPFLQGKIGFGEWLNRAIEGALADDYIRSNPEKYVASIGHTFEFSLDLNANASPAFTIVPSPATLVTPTGTVDRLDDNIVDVSLAKPATKDTSKTVLKPEKVAEKKQKLAELNAAEKTAATDDRLLKTDPDLVKAQSLQTRIEALTAPGSRSDETSRAQIEAERNENRVALQRLVTVKEELRNAQASRGDSAIAIRQIESDPANYRVVRSKSATPPSENLNIQNTQLQLTLERLINNTRITGF